MKAIYLSIQLLPKPWQQLCYKMAQGLPSSTLASSLTPFFCTLQDGRILSLSLYSTYNPCTPVTERGVPMYHTRSNLGFTLLLSSTCIVVFPFQLSSMSLFNPYPWELYFPFFLFSPVCKGTTGLIYTSFEPHPHAFYHIAGVYLSVL